MDFEWDKLTEAIFAAVFRVHNELGPGFLESIYQDISPVSTIPSSPRLHQK